MEHCPSENAFAALLDGHLPAADKTALHQHAELCNRCYSLMTEIGIRLSADGNSTCSVHGNRSPDSLGASDLSQHMAQRMGSQMFSSLLRRSPERLVFGGTERFRVERCLGEGGFGTVYQAFDEKRRIPVALKLLHRDNAEALVRFKQEFRGLANIRHRNLVVLHELQFDSGQWFFTMELIDGKNLIDFLRGDMDMGSAELPNETRLRDVFLQLVKGLHALHTVGKLHRDIKPSNVLVTREGRVVILDFGLIADLRTQLERRQDIPGTPAYMSPEQAAGLPLCEASDWYSFGVVLYEALCGRLPFSGKRHQILRNKQCADPPLPSAIVPRTCAELEALCLRLLDRAPSRRPSAREIRRALGEDRTGPLDINQNLPSFSSTPFLGRQPQLAVLRRAFLRSQQGRTAAVFIHGSSGIGKSALGHRFLDDIEANFPGTLILTGCCHERESVPYKALDGLIDRLSQFLRCLPATELEALLPQDMYALARLFPVLWQVQTDKASRPDSSTIPDSMEARRRAFAALRELLLRIAERQPVVLLVDDMQWGDVDSAVLLRELLHPPDAPPFLLIICYRSEEAATSGTLQALLHAPEVLASSVDVYDLLLKELNPEDAHALALRLLGESDSAAQRQAESLARESGGCPFFVHEMARYLQAGIAGAAACYRSEQGEGTTALADVIRLRIAGLPGGARSLLTVVAVAGQPVLLNVAKKAAALDNEEVLPELLLGHLLRIRETQVGTQIELYHDRFRDTIVGCRTDAELKQLHGRLAIALEDSAGADPETLSVHFHAAGDTAAAARYVAVAAEAASEVLAFERAARLYRSALELQPADAPERSRLHAKLGDALANLGKGHEAAQAFLAAAGQASQHARSVLPATPDNLEFQRRAAEQLLRSGYIEEGLKVVQGVLSAVGMKMASSPRRALSSVLYHRARLWLRGLDYREREACEVSPLDLIRIDACMSIVDGLAFVDTIYGADFQSRLLLLALQAGEPLRIANALCGEAGMAAASGDFDKAEDLTHKADVLANKLQNKKTCGRVALITGFNEMQCGRFKNGHLSALRAEEIFRGHCTGVSWEMASAQLVLLWCLGYLGEVKELERRVTVMYREAQQRGDLFATMFIRMGPSTLSWLAQDDVDGARSATQEAMHRWPHAGFHAQHFYELLSNVQIALYSENGRAAYEHLRGRWNALSSSLLLRVPHIRVCVRSLLARSVLALAQSSPPHRQRALLNTASRVAAELRREEIPWARAYSWLISGAIAARNQQQPQALDAFAKAIDLFDSQGMVLYSAAVSRRRAELLGGDLGRAQLEEADRKMYERSIRCPDRISAMFAPVPY